MAGAMMIEDNPKYDSFTVIKFVRDLSALIKSQTFTKSQELKFGAVGMHQHERLDQIIQGIYAEIQPKCSPLNISVTVSSQKVDFVIHGKKVSAKIA